MGLVKVIAKRTSPFAPSNWNISGSSKAKIGSARVALSSSLMLGMDEISDGYLKVLFARLLSASSSLSLPLADPVCL